MSHWHYMMVDGAKFWISYQRLAFLRSFSRWQLIQNLAPSTIVYLVSMWDWNSQHKSHERKNVAFWKVFTFNYRLLLRIFLGFSQFSKKNLLKKDLQFYQGGCYKLGYKQCDLSIPLIGWNYSVQTREQILSRIF